jgi:CHAP domain
MPTPMFRTRIQRSLPASLRTAALRLLSSFAFRILLAAGLAGAAAAPAAASLQCVPYARAVSGIAIHGNAGTWWAQAEGRYRRGREPQVGAVLAFQPSRAMPIGHVAVVAEIIDSRHIRLNHANWSGPGRIERSALAEDASPNGDWSVVRVWYAPQGSLGLRANPTFGFIYRDAPTDAVADTASEPLVAEDTGGTD